MAIKVLREGFKASPSSQAFTQQPVAQSQTPSTETIGRPIGSIGRTVGGGLMDFLQSLEGLGQTVFSREGQPQLEFEKQFAPYLPQDRPLSEVIKKQFNISPEDLKAQGLLESIGQRAIGLAPLSAVFGGAPAIARATLGAIPAEVAGKFGAPEWLKNILQIGTEFGIGKIPTTTVSKLPILKPVVGGIPTLKTTAAKEQKLMEMAPAKATELGPLKTTMNNVEGLLSTETDLSVEKEIRHVLGKIDSHIFQGKINPKKVVDLRKSIYKQMKRASIEDQIEYFNPITKGMNEFFVKYASENPEFFKHLNARDRLTEMKYLKGTIEEYAKTLGAERGFTLKKLSNIPKVILYPFGKFEKYAKKIAEEPVARQYYLDLAKSAVTNSPAAFFKSLSNLDMFYKKGEKTQPSAVSNFKTNPNIKILRGGFK